VLRRKHYSLRTEQSYVDWIKHFILFHGERHPAEMGKVEVTAFLTHLAVQRNVAALHPEPGAICDPLPVSECPGQELEWVEGFERPKRPARLPMIYTHVMNKGGRGVKSPLDRAGQTLAQYLTARSA